MEAFDWQDGERRIVFGRGRIAAAVELSGGPGYTLLTTERAAGAAPDVVAGAQRRIDVPGGLVDEIAGDLLAAIGPGERLVALGGGRVIDVAKALAAAREGSVSAIPTTLSGAEMTAGHRHARGVDPVPRNVRPRVVVNDPALTASQPVEDLAASALNALGHAVEGPCTPRANPVATLAADEAARLLCGAFAPDLAASAPGRDASAPDLAASAPDRDALALGALLAGYAIDSAGYGLHHVLSQTLVRVGGIPHANANAILLPHTIRALERRRPERLAALARVLGTDPALEAARVCAISGPRRLAELGVEPAVLEQAAEVAARRQENLAQTPPPADREEILAIYERAL